MPSSVPVMEGKGQDSENSKDMWKWRLKTVMSQIQGVRKAALCCRRLGMDPLQFPRGSVARSLLDFHSVKPVWATVSPELWEKKFQMFKATKFLKVVPTDIITHRNAREDWIRVGVEIKTISTLDNWRMRWKIDKWPRTAQVAGEPRKCICWGRRGGREGEADVSGRWRLD